MLVNYKATASQNVDCTVVAIASENIDCTVDFPSVSICPVPQVVRQELAAMSAFSHPQPTSGLHKGLSCVQLRLVLRGGMFKIDHHPMEVGLPCLA